jgi:RND family efflux transporter MFP subunit
MTKKLLIAVIFILILVAVGYFVLHFPYTVPKAPYSSIGSTTTTKVRFVNSTITADGSVTAQNQATLNFQTSGKLVRLPFKEGDAIKIGQTIAQLDTYQLQRQLTASLNTYRSTRDTFDQTTENAYDNALRPQVAPTYSKVNIDNNNAIDDAIKRIVDQNQASLDNSVINVELANYALQLSTLTSPLNGIITHETVSVSGVNITPTTTFTVADPDTIVFRANIPTVNIYYISQGNTVSISVDGIQSKLNGIVTKIYPSKIVLPNGQAVYQIDIESEDLKKLAKLDQSGRVSINTNSENVALVPVWIVLAGKYIWIDNSGTPELRTVTVGKIHESEIEIIGGLSLGDNIIIDPKYIPSLYYQLL